MIRRHLRKFVATGRRIYVDPVRRWMHRRGWLYSPSRALLDAFADFPGADWPPPVVRPPRPVEIQWVQRPELPKVPTYIGFCCREWVLAYGPGGRCGLCGERPVFLRPDTPEAEAEAQKPRERERIVVRSKPTEVPF